MTSLFPTDRPWPGWQKFLFRYIFVFLIVVLDPLAWVAAFVPANALLNANESLRTTAVEWSNKYFFHLRPVLVQPMGSGDTSFVWASVCLALCFSTLAALVWSIFDRRRPNYESLGYWFRNGIRYYIITIAVIYGSIKLVLGQMGTLSLTEMSTPVGQLSLMRMCWYFMASSPPYQFFSGVMELMVALLLLYRKTVTLGLLLGLAVFANVMMLNFSYDIPVKLFSSALVLCCVVLLFRDYERILSFLVLNTTAAPGRLYEPPQGKRLRVLRYSLKLIFIVGVIIIPGWQLVKSHRDVAAPAIPGFRYGVYELTKFVVNGDSSKSDSSRRKHWTRLVFDKNGQGTLFGDSTLFKYRYGRSAFGFRADSTAPHRITLASGFSDNPADPSDNISLSYEPLGKDTMCYRAKVGADSVYLEAHLTDTTYPLGHWRFHWLTEYVP